MCCWAAWGLAWLEPGRVGPPLAAPRWPLRFLSFLATYIHTTNLGHLWLCTHLLPGIGPAAVVRRLAAAGWAEQQQSRQSNRAWGGPASQRQEWALIRGRRRLAPFGALLCVPLHPLHGGTDPLLPARWPCWLWLRQCAPTTPADTTDRPWGGSMTWQPCGRPFRFLAWDSPPASSSTPPKHTGQPASQRRRRWAKHRPGAGRLGLGTAAASGRRNDHHGKYIHTCIRVHVLSFLLLGGGQW